MKKSIITSCSLVVLLVAALLYGCSTSTSTNKESTQNLSTNWSYTSSDVDNTLISVTYPTPMVGTAVGVSGAVIRTTNGGVTWSQQNSYVYQDLYAVSFADANTGVAVGSGGAAIQTTNGGQTWNTMQIDYNVQFRNVQMVDRNTIYAIGARYFDVNDTKGYVYKSTDGGLSWDLMPITASGLYGISFRDSKNGWVSGHNGQIWHTSDGGTTWTQQTAPNVGNGQQVTQIAFADLSHGYATGLDGVAGIPSTPNAGFIATTNDGGHTWSTKATTPLSGLAALDASHAVAVGYGGIVMQTNDAGNSWSTKSLQAQRLLNVCLTGFSTGTIVGENGSLYRLQ